MAAKIKVGLLYGGKSVEHEISLRSARNVAKFIDREKFEPVLIGIDPRGGWFLTQEIETSISSGQPLALDLANPEQSFFNLSSLKGEGQLEVVFPVLHGTDGEDGSIQGLLTTAGIPFVGTGVLGSAVAMDKLVSKKLLKEAGIPTSRFMYFHRDQADKLSFDQISKHLGLPFMTKPVALGSSVGITKVKREEDYAQALENIFKYDHTALCESYIEGRELECAVIGNRSPIASVPGEIIINPAYEFYTYEAKYEDEQAVEIKIPANLEEAQVNAIQKWSIAAYQALKCEDFARVDLFLDRQGGVFINEINTIPGFTNSSMFPSLWEASGINYTELITQLIDMALKRYQLMERLTRNYSPS